MTTTATTKPREPAQPAAEAGTKPLGGASAETAQAFAVRADELTRWAWGNLVNRIDVWGGYLPVGVRKPGESANVTKPAKADRGKKQLTLAIIKAHFVGADQGHVIGLHAIAPDNTCRWFAIEVDAHGEDRPDNWPATAKIIERLEAVGLFALVTDSNGRGGYHILVLLDSSLPSDLVYRFVQSIIDDWKDLGLSERPETFPKQEKLRDDLPYGNWLRLPGRHHTRDHWSRVWGGDAWYDGEDAVDLILKCPVNSSEIVAKIAPPEKKQTAQNPINGNGHHVDDAEKVKRASKYIDKIPGAVSGQRGSNPTLTAACECFRFGLSEADAWALLCDYSRRCDPPWNESELKHKLTDARKKVEADGEFGMRLHEDRAGWNGNCKPSNGQERTEQSADEAPDDQQPAAEQHQRQFEFTETGMAERVVAHRGDDFHHVSKFGKFIVWDGRRLRIDDQRGMDRIIKSEIRAAKVEAARMPGKTGDALYKFAHSCESNAKINAIRERIKAEAGVCVEPDEVDADPFLLNVRNGTIDLRTGELLAHDRRHKITKLADVEYDAAATCPTFDLFLERILPLDSVRQFVQRAVGYSATGNASERALFMPYGNGQNGKSTLLGAVGEILGDYATSIRPESLMVKRDAGIGNDLAALRGARFVPAIETEEGRRLAESLVKAMTGNDLLSVRFLYGEYFSFKPTFKLWIGTNHKPVVRGTDRAIWDRIKLIPFTVRIPDEEKDLKLADKLRAEYRGVLAWVVRGCLDWQQNGLDAPKEVQAATEDYRGEMDVLGMFISESCLVGAEYIADSTPLFEAYKIWSSLHNEDAMTQTRFGTQLGERGFEKARNTATGRMQWKGIGMRSTQ